MDEYDPSVAPDPVVWLALDEPDRIDLVQDYHEVDGIDLPNPHLHVLVENQLAEGEALPVREKLRQLIAQGLDRHDAVHAIGSVLMRHVADIAAGRISDTDPNPNRHYFSALRRLTARQWLRSAGR